MINTEDTMYSIQLNDIKDFLEASTSRQLADEDITLAVRWTTHRKIRPIGNNNCRSLVNIVFNDIYQ